MIIETVKVNLVMQSPIKENKSWNVRLKKNIIRTKLTASNLRRIRVVFVFIKENP